MDYSENEIFNNCSGSVLKIIAYDENGAYKWNGSAVVIKSRGVIVTNYHNIHMSSSFKLFFGEDEIQHDGILAMDVNKDLLLLSINNTEPFTDMSFDTNVKVTEDIITLGYPKGKLTITFGKVNCLDISIEDIYSPFANQRSNLIQFDAGIFPGSSGGALINRKGRLIGITTLTGEYGQNVNLAIKMDEVLNLLGNSSHKPILSKQLEENLLRFHLAIINGNYESVLHYINRCLKIDKDFQYFLYNKIALLVRLRRNNEAIQVCNKYLKVKNDKEVLWYKSLALYNEERFGEAYDIIMKSQRGNNFYDYLLRSVVCLKVSKFKSSLLNVNKALSINSKSKKARLIKAGIFIEQGKLNDAIQIVNKVSEQYPEDYEPYVILSDIYNKLGNNEKALEYINKSIEMNNISNPNNLNLDLTIRRDYQNVFHPLYLYHSKISILINMGKNEEALDELKSIYEGQSCGYEYYYLKAVIHWEMGLLDKALEEMNIAVKLNPRSCDANIKLSRILIGKKEYKKALTYIEKVLLMSPNNIDGLSLKATNLFALNHNSEVVTICNKVLKLDANNIETLYILREHYWRLEEFNHALRYAKRIINIEPDNQKNLLRVASILFRMYKLDDALVYYNKGLDLGPDLCAYIERSGIYIYFKKYDQALSDLNEIFKLNSKTAILYHLRGEVLFELQLYSKALSDFEEALFLDSNLESEVRECINKTREKLKS